MGELPVGVEKAEYFSSSISYSMNGYTIHPNVHARNLKVTLCTSLFFTFGIALWQTSTLQACSERCLLVPTPLSSTYPPWVGFGRWLAFVNQQMWYKQRIEDWWHVMACCFLRTPAGASDPSVRFTHLILLLTLSPLSVAPSGLSMNVTFLGSLRCSKLG